MGSVKAMKREREDIVKVTREACFIVEESYLCSGVQLYVSIFMLKEAAPSIRVQFVQRRFFWLV